MGKCERKRGRRQDQKEPEPEITADREALANWNRATIAQPLQVREAAPESPHPGDQEERRGAEEPQELRRPESDLPSEAVHPLRSRFAPGVASGCASRSPYSIG